jgi:hypothetical protein
MPPEGTVSRAGAISNSCLGSYLGLTHVTEGSNRAWAGCSSRQQRGRLSYSRRAGRAPRVVPMCFSCMPDTGQAKFRVAGGFCFIANRGTAGPLQQAFTWRRNSYSGTRGLSMRIHGVICRAANVHVYTVKNPFTYTFKRASSCPLRDSMEGSGNRFPGRIPGGDVAGKVRGGTGLEQVCRCWVRLS